MVTVTGLALLGGLGTPPVQLRNSYRLPGPAETCVVAVTVTELPASNQSPSLAPEMLEVEKPAPGLG